MKSEIIAVGSEMLTPFRQDTNSLYLTEKLNELGVTVAFKTIVGDRQKDLVNVLRAALGRADIVAIMGGLGRPQGLALSKDGDVYLAACLHGHPGLVRVTPDGEASLVLAGHNLIGVAFSPLGTTILATNIQTQPELNGAVYDVDLGVEGMTLF